MKGLVWTFVGIGVLAAVVWPLLHDSCIDCMLLRRHPHGRSERNAPGSLKTLVSAQEDFRSNDRDGNRMEDYWRGDVAGLYALIPPGTTDRIKLIELSVAGADPKASTDQTAFTVRAPKAGYWFKALLHTDEVGVGPNPRRFAFCAYPDSPSAGKLMYVVDERAKIYQAPQRRGGVEHFPDAATLRKEWTKVD